MSSARPKFAPLRRRGPRRDGFTLLELVLAMGMVAIISVSLFAMMKNAFDHQKTAAEAVEPSRTVAIAMDFIRPDFENALPPHDLNNFKSQYQYLAGDFEGQTGGASGNDADVMFYTISSMKQHPSANGEIMYVELTTDTVDGKKCLVRKASRNLTVEQMQQQPPQPLQTDEEVLIRGIDSFTVQYYDGSNWNDTWDSTQMTPNELPAAVQVTITLDRTEPDSHGPKRLLTFTRVIGLTMSTMSTDTDNSDGGLSL